jgi:hypothetical protein
VLLHGKDSLDGPHLRFVICFYEQEQDAGYCYKVLGRAEDLPASVLAALMALRKLGP